MCIEDENGKHYSSVLDDMYHNKAKIPALVILISSFVLVPLLVLKLNKKKKDIKNPINNESYCFISIWICDIVIVSLGFTLASNLGQVF